MMPDWRDSICWALGSDDFTPLDDLHRMGRWRSGVLFGCMIPKVVCFEPFLILDV